MKKKKAIKVVKAAIRKKPRKKRAKVKPVKKKKKKSLPDLVKGKFCVIKDEADTIVGTVYLQSSGGFCSGGAASAVAQFNSKAEATAAIPPFVTGDETPSSVVPLKNFLANDFDVDINGDFAVHVAFKDQATSFREAVKHQKISMAADLAEVQEDIRNKSIEQKKIVKHLGWFKKAMTKYGV